MTTPQSDPSGMILVEGQDDRHVLVNLCRRRRDLFTISSVDTHLRRITSKLNGKTLLISERDNRRNVIAGLPEVAKTEGIEILGLLLDADQSLEQTWQEITAALQKAGISPPNQLPPTGLIIPADPENTPRLGVWIMPDNQSPGELEDFLFQMIPPDSANWPAAQEFIERIPPESREFLPHKTDKAKLHAWLATMREPARMGAAIDKGKIDDQNPLFQTFIHWLQKLLQ